jgi:hypothetical protein
MQAVRRFVGDHSLSLVLLSFFLVFLAAESVAGHRTFNADQRDHGEATIGYSDYLTTGHFGETVFENWESEFLQMGVYVLFTVSADHRSRRGPGSRTWTNRRSITSPTRPPPGPYAGAAWRSPSTGTR